MTLVGLLQGHGGQQEILRRQSESVEPAFYSFSELARRWRCSRASVYNRLRGETVLDFARPGRRGKKLIPAATVERIEQRHLRRLR